MSAYEHLVQVYILDVCVCDVLTLTLLAVDSVSGDLGDCGVCGQE